MNPQVKRTKLKEICDCFFKNNILHVSSYPTLRCFFQTQPCNQKRENRFNYSYYEKYYALLEKIWMVSGEEILFSDLNILDFDRLVKGIDKKVGHLLSLEKKIQNLSFNNVELSVIQNGYMGIGINYFVGEKI